MRVMGLVLDTDSGVSRVLTDQGEMRASLGGRMLGRIARDRSLLPEPGDWVRLRLWSDGRLTIEDTLQLAPKATEQLAQVISLDSRR